MSDKRRIKQVLLDWTALSSEDNVSAAFICLTPQQRSIIQSALLQFYWPTRWLNPPNASVLEETLNAISVALSQPCCDALAVCIRQLIDDGSLDGSLGGWINRNGDGSVNTPYIRDENPTFVETCDMDQLFGSVTALVDLLNDTSSTLFAYLELATNITEQLSILSAFMPVVNIASLVGVVSSFIDTLTESIGENYDAAWNDVLRDEIRCELLCRVQYRCSVDYIDVRDYFAEKVSANVGFSTVLDVITFFDGISLSGDLVVYGMFWLIVELLGFGVEVGGVSAGRVNTVMRLADPDPDWNGLCDVCDNCMAAYGGDGDLSEPGFLYGDWGQYDAENDRAVGTLRVLPGGSDFLQLQLKILWPGGRTFTRIRMEVAWNNPVLDPDGNDAVWSIVNTGANPDTVIAQKIITSAEGDVWYETVDTGDISVTTNEITINVVSRHAKGAPETSVAEIRKLRVCWEA